MPRKREGFSQLSTLVPTEVFVRIDELADANGRSRTDEVIHALTRHLETPPTVVVEAPPLPPAEVPPPPTKRPRGRPRRPAPPAQGGS